MTEQQLEIKHTGGVGAFFYGAIFPTIGIGLVIFFAFYTGVVEWHKQQAIEGRMDGRVGADASIRAPIDLLFHGKGCIVIERAFIDQDAITAYLHNKCPREIKDVEYAWREIAPDGTTVKSGDNYLSGDANMQADEKREQTNKISASDRRVKTVIFSISNYSDYQN